MPRPVRKINTLLEFNVNFSTFFIGKLGFTFQEFSIDVYDIKEFRDLWSIIAFPGNTRSISAKKHSSCQCAFNVTNLWQHLCHSKLYACLFFSFLVKSLTFIDFPDRAEIDHLSFCATAFSLSTKMKAHICQRKEQNFFFRNAMAFIGKFQILDFWCCWLIYFMSFFAILNISAARFSCISKLQNVLYIQYRCGD